MRIVCKVFGSKEGLRRLLDLLSDREVQTCLVRGGFIVKLQCVSGQPGICVAEYLVPPEIPSSYCSEYFLEAEEERFADGSYTVVCGARGGMLKPFLILGNGKRSYVSAMFSVRRKLVTVTACGGHVSIEEQRLVVTGDPSLIELQTRSLWQGREVDLPHDRMPYREAVRAAVAGQRYYRTR